MLFHFILSKIVALRRSGKLSGKHVILKKRTPLYMHAGHVRFLFFGSPRAGFFINLSTSFLARLKCLAERVISLCRVSFLYILFGNLAYILLASPTLYIFFLMFLSCVCCYINFFLYIFPLSLSMGHFSGPWHDVSIRPSAVSFM